MTLSVQLLQIPPSETVIKREYYLTGDTFSIGRDFGADICLPDLSETMSRRHLVVSRTPAGAYTINDCSANGASMNGAPLPPRVPQTLSDGDILSFAGYKLLFGIVDQVLDDEPISYRAEQRFEAETDFSDTRPILPDLEIEELPPEPEQCFSATEVDLDPDLMFDPFAEGPEMREPERPKFRPTGAGGPAKACSASPPPAFDDPVDMVDLDGSAGISRHRTARPAAIPALPDAHVGTVLYPEDVSEAMEQALERFLQELDPAVLQGDYDDYIPRLASRQKRYWTIHSRQFAKKKTSGEFRRTFRALFAEEMRKL